VRSPHRRPGCRRSRSRHHPGDVEVGVDIDRFLATHDGVISRAQARACGLSDGQIARRVSRHEWVRRAPRVFFATAWAWTAAAHVRVAAQWAWPIGTLLARGLWVTSRPLTVLDAAVALGATGQAFLDRALQQHVTLDELRVVQHRHLGRHGSATAGRLLTVAADRAASRPERLFLTLLGRAGLTGWVVNLDVVLASGQEVVIDVAFAEVRLAIEVDGWAHHVDPARFVSDRARKRALVADSWTVVEVTWADLVGHPERVIAEIRRILVRLSARGAAG
jgi:very-short-patch-repair endonuclease